MLGDRPHHRTFRRIQLTPKRGKTIHRALDSIQGGGHVSALTARDRIVETGTYFSDYGTRLRTDHDLEFAQIFGKFQEGIVFSNIRRHTGIVSFVQVSFQACLSTGR